MTPRTWPPSFLQLLEGVRQKRARVVIDHILEHGHVTTEELKDRYGYNHPPRAARDVREQGIPLETFRIPGADGRLIGAYRFGDPAQVRFDRTSGRTAFAVRLKAALIEERTCCRNLDRCPFAHAVVEANACKARQLVSRNRDS